MGARLARLALASSLGLFGTPKKSWVYFGMMREKDKIILDSPSSSRGIKQCPDKSIGNGSSYFHSMHFGPNKK